MKFACAAALLLAAIGLALPSRATVPTLSVTFDADGHGTWESSSPSAFYGGATSGTLLSTFGADPTGGKTDALIYDLPVPVSTGALDVHGFGGSGIAATFAFTDPSGDLSGNPGSLLVFYSANTTGGLLGDTGLPSYAGSKPAVATVDGLGNFTFLASGGFPTGNTYNGFLGNDSPAGSGTAPEPGSLALFLVAAGTTAGSMTRRRFRSN